MRRLALLLLIVTLNGCWIGDNFYAASDLRQPIPPGLYRSSELIEGTMGSGTVRLSYRADGFAMVAPVDAAGIEDRGDASVIGFAAIDAESRLFAAWQVDEAAARVDGRYFYVLLRREENGDFTYFMPSCEGSAAAAANAEGAAMVNESGAPTCAFPTRASLESALRAAEPHLTVGARFTPLASD